MHRYLYLIIFLLLFSCSSEKPDEYRSQEPSKALVSAIPSYSLQITPSEATHNSTLYLIPGGFSLSDAKIEWLVNGILAASALPDQFRTTEINKDNTVQAKAVIKGTEVLSNVVKIKNSPPEISKIKILPDVFKPGDNLYVEVTGADPDGDNITFSYEWIKNGEPVGVTNRLEGSLKRGDKVIIKITPYDGEDYGRTAIVKREIKNTPPTILENKELIFYGRTMTYQVKAEDPDGDTLIFSLKSAPEGMQIEPSTGLITWNMPLDATGKQSLTVAVSDGNGGEAVQSFNFELTPIRR